MVSEFALVTQFYYEYVQTIEGRRLWTPDIRDNIGPYWGLVQNRVTEGAKNDARDTDYIVSSISTDCEEILKE